MTSSDPFPRIDGRLTCGPFGLDEVAERFGTPVYVYDAGRIEERYRAFEHAFAGTDLLVAYSIKANGNLALLQRLGALGSGADIVSLGELRRATLAGIPGERIVFAGVGKSREEMVAGLDAGIYSFHVESDGELRLLAKVAAELGVRAPFGLRVNLDISSPTPHEYTRTGHAASKFGIPVDETVELYRWAAGRPELHIRGIDIHIGSQIVEVEPYARALEGILELVRRLESDGIRLEYLDLGGGFGVGYDSEPGMRLEALAKVIVPAVTRSGLRLVLEPGRSIVADAGVLLTRVHYVKRSGAKTFVVSDGGMTELLRPSHYGGHHVIEPVHLAEGDGAGGGPTETVDVVGPICESGDFLARDRVIPRAEPGDLLAVRMVGAYGFAMASNYNSRRRPPEVMIEDGEMHLVRARETLDDLVRGETIPARSARRPAESGGERGKA
jgi:diaminopimelate decarboxylase